MRFFGSDRHKNELDVPPSAARDPEGVEIARIWVAAGKQVVALRAGTWEDPRAWGLMLVDLARHVANAYEQLGRGAKADVLNLIREGFDVEWESPTDEATGEVQP